MRIYNQRKQREEYIIPNEEDYWMCSDEELRWLYDYYHRYLSFYDNAERGYVKNKEQRNYWQKRLDNIKHYCEDVRMIKLT